MINESPREVKGYWFFTPYTIPNKKLLALLNPERHEIALHVANKTHMKNGRFLEKETNRTSKAIILFMVPNGKFARLIWGRKLSGPQVAIPLDFPLTFLSSNYDHEY